MLKRMRERKKRYKAKKKERLSRRTRSKETT